MNVESDRSAKIPPENLSIPQEILADEFRGLLAESRGKIGHCLSQLSDEQVWWRPAPELNSIGNLILHVSGNMRQWVVCGMTDAVDRRDRDGEFRADSTMGPDALLATLDAVISDVEKVLRGVDSSQLTRADEVQGFPVSGFGILMHSIPHFVGHTHQIIQLTRMQLGAEYRFAWSPDGDRNRIPI